MRIETQRLVLRPFNQNDAKAALAWLGDPRAMAYIESVFDLAKAQKFIRDCGHLVYCLCEKESGVPIGQVIWHPYGGDPARYELGWILAPAHWGRGYAEEISLALIAWAKRQKVRQILLEAVAENRASIALIERLGAVFSHCDGALQVYRIEF